MQKIAIPKEVQDADPKIMRDWEAEWVNAAYKSRIQTDTEERKKLFEGEEEIKRKKIEKYLDEKKQEYREMADCTSI